MTVKDSYIFFDGHCIFLKKKSGNRILYKQPSLHIRQKLVKTLKNIKAGFINLFMLSKFYDEAAHVLYPTILCFRFILS